MTDVLKFKGFIGSVHFSAEDKTFFGKIEGINDLVTFEADAVDKLVEEFQQAVSDYLDICKEQGKDPVKSAKGSFNVRTKPAIHNLALRLSTLGGYRSLNQYVSAAIEEKNNRELAG